jgi:hypothetical protein
MSSNSAKTKVRRKLRHKNAGRLRKKKEAVKSTPSYAELFASLGEPGQPLKAQSE